MLLKKTNPSRIDTSQIIGKVFDGAKSSIVARAIIEMLSQKNEKFNDDWEISFSSKDYDIIRDFEGTGAPLNEFNILDNYFVKEGYLKSNHAKLLLDREYQVTDKFLETIQKFIKKPPHNLNIIIDALSNRR